MGALIDIVIVSLPVYLVANLAMKPTGKLQVVFAFALRLMSESISLLELQPAYNMPDCFRLSRFV